MDTFLLEFDHVCGNRGKFRLKDIHFSLPAGYIMAIAGYNGAGKTTLLKYILEDSCRYDGTIRIDGKDIHPQHAYTKNKIGFVSEENNFFSERTAEQNAQILGLLYEQFDTALFLSAMKRMELSPQKVYGKMSRGERMKFQLAFAMAHHSRLYLLDEVTAGMDPVFRIEFFRLLQEIVMDKTASVVMVSHIASEIERKTDYVAILENGKMIQFGESMDILPLLSKGEAYEDKKIR